MTGWILVGDMSFGLRDIKRYEDVFKSLKIDFRKVHLKDVYDEFEKITPDFVITAYFGNIDNYSLNITRFLENQGVEVINTAKCIEDVLDKSKSISMIKNTDSTIAIPKTINFNDIKNMDFSFPAVVKINKGSQGKGVALAENYHEAVKKAQEFKTMFNDEIILQEYVLPSYGKDVRFILCKGSYVVSFVRVNKYDFRSNIAEGAHIELYNPNEYEKRMAEKIGNILGINLGSVDFLYGKDGLVFCEANGMPGVKYTEFFIENGLGDPLIDICRRIAL